MLSPWCGQMPALSCGLCQQASQCEPARRPPALFFKMTTCICHVVLSDLLLGIELEGTNAAPFYLSSSWNGNSACGSCTKLSLGRTAGLHEGSWPWHVELTPLAGGGWLFLHPCSLTHPSHCFLASLPITRAVCGGLSTWTWKTCHGHRSGPSGRHQPTPRGPMGKADV
jgi:hypothetical protein